MVKININDVTEDILVPKNFEELWKEIFAKQMQLAEKYSDIEKMGDLLETTKNNVDTPKGQKWLKDFAWRVTEELTEAEEAHMLALKQSIKEPELMNQYTQHYKEELADALHFLVELSIIAGYDHTIVKQEKVDGNVASPWYIVYQMGLMCNCLKNKPWKQTQMLTDRPKFESYLEATWLEMRNLLRAVIGGDKDVYKYYFKKNKVNQFRQRSKY